MIPFGGPPPMGFPGMPMPPMIPPHPGYGAPPIGPIYP